MQISKISLFVVSLSFSVSSFSSFVSQNHPSLQDPKKSKTMQAHARTIINMHEKCMQQAQGNVHDQQACKDHLSHFQIILQNYPSK